MKYGITLAGVPGAELKGVYAKKAQDEGYNSAWTDDNPGSDGSIHMASMAKSAPDIRVGSGILRAFLRNPVTIASAFMTMNALSNTNVILGFGTGTKRQNLYQYGIEINKPISQLRSVIGIVRSFWSAANTGELFTWDDEFYKIKGIRPVRAQHIQNPNGNKDKESNIPIWVAAVNVKMQQFAGEVADGMCGHPVFGADYMRDVVKPNIEIGRSNGELKTPFELACWATTVVHKDKNEARRLAGQTIANYLSTKSYQGILQYYGIGDRYEDIRQACLVDRDMDRASALIGNEVIDRIAVTGPIDEVAEELKKRYEGIVDHVVVASAGITGYEERMQTIDSIISCKIAQ
ncbi:MAG: LLM class flavin-dependent oxidoreductase [Dehalococcoidia bacterium]|nr:LLM class flavin-dependent oxidoreductase [Dehalococcoidia bacterium]